MSIHPMWDEIPEIKNQLSECLTLIKEKTTIENKQIQDAIFELLDSGGKLLRPAYFLLFSKLGNVKELNHQQIISAAASTEVLHLATLIHDDIIDDSPIRRGSQTVQSRYGKDVAVYTGDLLLAVHFELLADATESTHIIKNNALSMRRVLLGELEQMINTYNMDITFNQYLKNIEGKTAQLFELSCSQGTYWGQENSDIIRHCAEIGHYVGIAFQMLDDILDYSQTSEMFEKPVLEDVKQGIYSLPLILALQENKEVFVPFLKKGAEMTESDVAKVVLYIDKYQGIEKAYLIAQDYTNQALQLIEDLPSSSAKKVIYQLTQKLLQRTF